MERWGLSERIPSAWRPMRWLSVALLAVICAGGVPVVWLGIVALGDAGRAGPTLLSSGSGRLLMNTVRLGLVAAGLAGAVGTALGLFLAKADLAGRRTLMAMLSLPLFLPPYVLALGWFTILGRQGAVAALLGSPAGAVASDAFFGISGAVLVLTVAYTPIVLYLVRLGLAAIDPATEEAARLRFTWPRVVRRIDLPLIAPAIALGMLLTFILVAGEFGVTAYLRYPVFSGAVFTQFAAFLDVRAAVVTSIPLGLLVIGGVLAERSWLRARVTFERARIVSLVTPLGPWRTLATAIVWAYALLTVALPFAGLIHEAGAGVNYVAALRGAGTSIVTSLWTAALAATVMAVLGFLLAYFVERTARGRRNLVDTGLIVLFALPGTVLGVALILLWNRRGLTSIYASVGIILIGYVAHYTPLAARVIGISLQAASPGLEEAARLAGVSWTRMIRCVLVPAVAPAVASAWALAFVFCLRDLDLVMTIHPPGVETLPVRLYTLMANSASSVTAALSCILVLLTVTCVLVTGAGLALVRRTTAWS
jgi:iron(III) transport system permease protein